MKILVTGSNGFVGKNLVSELQNRNLGTLFLFDQENTLSELEGFCRECDFVFHLAGVNRPDDVAEFMKGNYELTAVLTDYLQKYNNKCPVMMSSSSQAFLDNPYGESKRAGENTLFEHGKINDSKTLIYRFPNIFGKWCRPNYNSAIATFCHNIAHGLDVKVNDPNVELKLVYIDDVVKNLIDALNGTETRNENFCEVDPEFTVRLGDIVEAISSFKNNRNDLQVPNMSNAFIKRLYSTYLSYLPIDAFSYLLKMNSDDRGSFTEFIRTEDRGQVSINISKPGITKGNHWHHTKNEKFLVVCGKGVIRFRKIDSDQIIEYFVDGSKLEAVDIPVGYTHNIENLGDSDMVTVMWVNESFNSERPDTYFLKV